MVQFRRPQRRCRLQFRAICKHPQITPIRQTLGGQRRRRLDGRLFEHPGIAEGRKVDCRQFRRRFQEGALGKQVREIPVADGIRPSAAQERRYVTRGIERTVERKRRIKIRRAPRCRGRLKATDFLHGIGRRRARADQGEGLRETLPRRRPSHLLHRTQLRFQDPPARGRGGGNAAREDLDLNRFSTIYNRTTQIMI